jgi:hypothetical protein
MPVIVFLHAVIVRSVFGGVSSFKKMAGKDQTWAADHRVPHTKANFFLTQRKGRKQDNTTFYEVAMG